MTALQRSRGQITATMVLLDVREKNSPEDRSWLRDPERVEEFYERLRAGAAHVHAKIEAYNRSQLRISQKAARELKLLYVAFSQRIPFTRMAIKPRSRTALTETAARLVFPTPRSPKTATCWPGVEHADAMRSRCSTRPANNRSWSTGPAGRKASFSCSSRSGFSVSGSKEPYGTPKPG